ncbi:elongation factor 1 alpha like protein [Schizosaccharomyces cryophilus OY26]|uniref:Elongation factor 1 alpha-like protein n=1 Tax=Schizosaccharomyces cryophilus (strain OY26 / ATCC MYA-4695 / CBS 11777 / NBRC 106824 / NRRL Y48691) TaxID=653667 RepID=S9W1I0_SCHCR|nr:elongation factor 1 alpha like protein [Schizosaccharomyces cryophilus OY26]EPY53838.1 elongation factor 1 alpha like protein [Schizosaccharomyces cryophilus OY26]
MSRHRNIKNLDLAEYDYEDEPAQEELTDEQEEQFREAIAAVQETLDGLPVTTKEIADTVWYYFFDVEKSINYLLKSCTTKAAAQKEKEESEKKKQNKQEQNSTAGNRPSSKKTPVPLDASLEKLNLDGKEQTHETAKGLEETQKVRKQESSALIDVPKIYEESHPKPVVHLVVTGHVDSGKSTMLGRIMYQLGDVNSRSMQKLHNEAANQGKGSFSYAWLLDSTDEERLRGVTMDVAATSFESKKQIYEVGDAPGHKDFISGMIAGAASAEFAILVVDSSQNNYERGFLANGQTREHAYLLRALGVSEVAVAVNKLDLISWSSDRYFEIKSSISDFLVRMVGFKEENVHFIPVSAVSGVNLIEKQSSPLYNWYDGPTLIEVLDNFIPPLKSYRGPLRVSVYDTYRSVRGATVSGRVESGSIQNGQVLYNVSSQEDAYVKSVMRNSDPSVSWAVAGDSVTLQLTDIEPNQISLGDILSTYNDPVKRTKSFIAEIQTFDILGPILSGSTLVLHRGRTVASVSVKIISVNGKKARHITSRKRASIQVNFLDGSYPVCPSEESSSLSRIILRRDGNTIAAGIVKTIL